MFIRSPNNAINEHMNTVIKIYTSNNKDEIIVKCNIKSLVFLCCVPQNSLSLVLRNIRKFTKRLKS